MGGATQTDRRPAVLERLATIPIQDRTTARVFAIMNEVGVQNQGAMYDYVVKSGLVPKELDLYKESQKEETGRTAIGAPEFALLPPEVQRQLPSVPKEPLGRIRIGAGSTPLTPEILEKLVNAAIPPGLPKLQAAPIPGAPPQPLTGLPPEALFGFLSSPADL